MSGIRRLLCTTDLDRIDLTVAFDLSGWDDRVYLFEWSTPSDVSPADIASLLRAAADQIETQNSAPRADPEGG